MKKEKINELLNEYRKTFSGDIDKDLKKFNSSEKVAYAKKINKKLIISVSCIVIIAVFTIVFNSIIMSNNPAVNTPSLVPTQSPNDGEQNYFDTGDLKYSTIDSIDIFNTENNCNVRKISLMEYKGLLIQTILFKEDDTVIGVTQNMAVLNEQIKDITVRAYVNNNDVENLYYHTLPYEISWDSITIKYNMLFDIYIYKYYIQFKQDGVIYKIDVNCYEEIDIVVLLDEIFD